MARRSRRGAPRGRQGDGLRRPGGGPLRRAALLAAVALSGCAPQWTGSQVVTGDEAANAGGVPAGTGAAPAAGRLEQSYAAIPLGTRVRAKRLSVLLISVGDVAVYRHDAPDGEATLSAVLRSYTTFRDRSLEDVDEYLTNVERGYRVTPGEIDGVRTFIRNAVADVTYYRIDLRYTVGALQGAVLVYEFREEAGDRLLATRLLSPPSALAAIHFADADGFELAPDDTILHQHFLVAEQDGKLEVTPRSR